MSPTSFHFEIMVKEQPVEEPHGRQDRFHKIFNNKNQFKQGSKPQKFFEDEVAVDAVCHRVFIGIRALGAARGARTSRATRQGLQPENQVPPGGDWLEN